MDAWLKAAVNYIPAWLDYQMRLSGQPGCVPRHRVQGARRPGEGVRRCRCLHGAGADAAPSPPRGVPHEELHRGRGDEAPRSRRASSGRSGGPLRRRAAPERGGDDARAAAVAHRRRHSRRCRGRAVPGSAALHEREGAARGARRAADHRTQHPVQVLEPRLRPRRARHGGRDRGALPRVDRARDRRTERAARDHARRAGAAARAGGAGHTRKLPLGHRLVVPGDNPTHAIAPAGGFVSTAGDLARFFASLDPAAKRSVLSPASRREMIRKQWHDEHGSMKGHYGLGIMGGKAGAWEWFGHAGGFQSCLSRTVVLPGRDVAVSILTNALDGPAWGLVGRRHPHPAGVREARRAERQDARLGRPLVEHVAHGRPRADAGSRAGRRSGSRGSVLGRERDRGHGPRRGDHPLRARYRQLRGGRAPGARQERPCPRGLARRDQVPAGAPPRDQS